MKKKSFLKNFVLYLLSLIIPLIILSSVSIILSHGYLYRTIDQNNRLVLDQTKYNVELILNQINNLSLTYDLNSTVGYYLDIGLQNKTSTYNSTNVLNVIKTFLNVESQSRPYIHSIYVYFDSTQDRFFSSKDGIANLNTALNTDWYASYKKQDPSVKSWSELRDMKQYSFEKPTRVISIYRRTLSRQGVIVLNLLPGYIKAQPYMNEPVGGQYPYILILNEANQVIMQNTDLPFTSDVDFSELAKNPTDSFSVKVENELYTVSKVESVEFGWKVISIMPRSALYKLPTQITITMCLVFGLCLLLGFLLAYRASRRNYRQINNIVELLNAAEQGRPLPAVTSSRSQDEYTYITDNLIKTFVEQRYIKIALSEKIFRNKTLELLALQSQINPHFLFNTLKTIYWKSYNLTDGQNDVSKMIETLSDLLNYSLGQPQEMVPIRAEIHQTHNYLEIQKIRYPDKFDVLWQVDDTLLDIRIIKLILQPVVENSIHHGIIAKEERSCIKIKLHRRRGLICFTIIDNGLGMQKEVLEELRRQLSQTFNPKQEIRHIGLYNTAKRVTINYGEGASITVRSKYLRGTSVTIAIPDNMQQGNLKEGADTEHINNT